MAHNFTGSANLYVSKAGNDANAGTDPNSPKLTLASAVSAMTNGQTVRLGEGYYYESIALGSKFGTFIGDGIVVIDCAAGGFTHTATSSTYVFTNIRFINGTGYSGVSATGGSVTFNICRFLMNLSGDVQFRTFNYCSFVSSSITCTGRNTHIAYNNTYVNSTIAPTVNFTQFYNNIVDSGSIVSTTSVIVAANYNYNCLVGGIRHAVATPVSTGTYQDVAGNYYNLALAGSGGTGTLGDPFRQGNTAGATFYLATHKILYTTYNVNSFSSDPQFNHSSAYNFTIALTSPCFKTGVGLVTIGAFEAAFVQKAGVDITGTFTNISGTTDLTVTSGTTGTIEEDWVAFSPSFLKTLGIFRYTGALTFDKSQSGGTARNRNVPDTTVYAGADASGGGNPDRLVFELAWYTGSGTPAVLADADNGGYATAGTYVKFRWGLEPSFDSFGVSNGEPSWNYTTPQIYINCTYFKKKTTLADNYV